MARLFLSFLGPARFTREPEAAVSFESNKVRALLVYLVMGRDRPHSREELAGLLWPERSEQAAATNLRQALANLRRAIGGEAAEPPFLLATRESIQFNPAANYWLDVEAFTRLVAASQRHVHRRAEACRPCAQHLAEAVALYRGGFLEHFVVSASSAFEEWVLVEREKLHRLALTALDRLATHHARRGEHAQAYQYAARQIELDPWREEAHRQAMQSLAASGERSAALEQYAACRRSLAQELGVDPTEETQRLYNQIKAGLCGPESISGQPLTNLPAQPTAFIGRAAELAEIAERLENPACRLLTLVGPGGIGKTRLALQAAAQQVGSFQQGVFYVPLEAVPSEDLVPAAIARALGFKLTDRDDPAAQIVSRLRPAEMLLVLDTYEHLLAGGAARRPAAALLPELLRQARWVSLLVTSREQLNLQAEWVFDLPGLPYPVASAAASSLEQFDAVQLFARRAAQADRRFALGEANSEPVARICRLVEGLPLAIELAAASVGWRDPAAIAEDLERGARALASTLQDVPDRHRSLGAAFEQSWHLLTPDERQAFRGLAVFRGGFQCEASTAVAGATPAMLAELVHKSLLRREPAERYELHSLLRQHAADKLSAAGEVEAARDRHRDYFTALAEAAEPHLYAAQQHQWLEQLEAEHANLRAALEWALESRNLESASRLGAALSRFWGLRGYLREGRQWLGQVLDQWSANGAPLDPALKSRVVLGAGMLAWRQSDFEAAASLMEQSLRLARAAGEPAEINRRLHSLATVEASRGNLARAAALVEECLDGDRRSGNRERIAYDLGSLGDLAFDQGDLAQARDYYQESLALHRERGDENSVAICLNNLGEVARLQGELAQSAVLVEEALALFRRLDIKQNLALALTNLAELRRATGGADGAWALYREALQLQYTLGARGDMLTTLLACAALARNAGELERGARLYAATQALADGFDIPLSSAQAAEVDAGRAATRSKLSEAVWAQAWAAGSALTLEEAIDHAVGRA